MIKRILIIVSIFVVSLAIQILLLFSSASISNSTIVNNYKESADFLCERQVFFELNEGINASKIDRYADSILLNIAWNIDKNIESILMDSYYYTDSQNENDNLHDSVYDGKTANQQYMRYWHGSAAIIRALHVVCNIKQIYIINAIVMGILIILTMINFLKKRMVCELISTIIGLITAGIWYVPMSLEYTWTFIIMMIVVLVAIHFAEDDFYLILVMFISGIVTNYLDFLTTETLTMLIPLIIVCRIRFKYYDRLYINDTVGKSGVKSGNTNTKFDYLWITKMCMIWVIGYATTWIMKWVITAVVTGQDVLPLISGHIEERLNGDVGNIGILNYIAHALGRNVSCLFPVGFGALGVAFTVILIMGFTYVCYVYHGKDINRHRIIIYGLIGIVPFIRYMVLHNHAYLHYFFTYRALMVSTMTLCFIAEEIIDGRYIGNAFFRRR